MENKIEYVLYENVKDNEYINKIKPIDDAVKKLKELKMELLWKCSTTLLHIKTSEL